MCDREVGQPRGYQPLVMWTMHVAVMLLCAACCMSVGTGWQSHLMLACL